MKGTFITSGNTLKITTTHISSHVLAAMSGDPIGEIPRLELKWYSKAEIIATYSKDYPKIEAEINDFFTSFSETVTYSVSEDGKRLTLGGATFNLTK